MKFFSLVLFSLLGILLFSNGIESKAIQKRLWGSVFKPISSAVSSVTSAVTSGVTSVVSGTGSLLTGAVDLVTDGANLLVSGVNNLVGNVINEVSNGVNQVVNSVNDLAQSTLNHLPGGVVTGLISNIINEASNGIQTGVNGINSVSQGVLSVTSSSLNTLLDATNQIGHVAVNQALGAVNDAVTHALELNQNILSESLNALQQCVTGVANLSQSVIDKYLDTVNKVVKKMTDIALGVVNEVLNTATQLVTAIKTFIDIGGSKCLSLIFKPNKDNVSQCLKALDSVVGVSSCATAFLSFSSDALKNCGALVANFVSPGSGAIMLLMAECINAKTKEEILNCGKQAATMLFSGGLQLPTGIQNLVGDTTGVINGLVNQANGYIEQVNNIQQNIVNQVLGSIPVDLTQVLSHDLVNTLPQNVVNNLAENVISNLDINNGEILPATINGFVGNTIGSLQNATGVMIQNVMQNVFEVEQSLTNVIPISEIETISQNLSGQLGHANDLAHNAVTSLFAQNLIETLPIDAVQDFVEAFTAELSDKQRKYELSH